MKTRKKESRFVFTRNNEISILSVGLIQTLVVEQSHEWFSFLDKFCELVCLQILQGFANEVFSKT